MTTHTESRTDRLIYWLADHPRATGFILAGLILAVGFLENPNGG